MLHHVSLPVAELARAARLYDAALAALGYRRWESRPGVKRHFASCCGSPIYNPSFGQRD